uniref:Uncharacterized protein n=1 Tax=Anguilla anguilla TaxID=7936 RepID=A0A0E9RCJ1_ANGAN
MLAVVRGQVLGVEAVLYESKAAVTMRNSPLYIWMKTHTCSAFNERTSYIPPPPIFYHSPDYFKKVHKTYRPVMEESGP